MIECLLRGGVAPSRLLLSGSIKISFTGCWKHEISGMRFPDFYFSSLLFPRLQRLRSLITLRMNLIRQQDSGCLCHTDVQRANEPGGVTSNWQPRSSSHQDKSCSWRFLYLQIFYLRRVSPPSIKHVSH